MLYKRPIRADFTSRPRLRRYVAVAAFSAGLLAALLTPGFAAALPTPVLLETTGGQTASKLYRVDPSTGATTPLGETGYAITGLAQDPTTGVLYGASSNKSPIASRTFLQINPATGATNAVGPFGAHIIADMTFDSQGRLFGWDEENDDLASIDKASGSVTVIPSGIDTAGSGSSFDRNDVFWQFGGDEAGPYYAVDTTTGQATERGTLTPIDGAGSQIGAAAWDCARTTLYATVAPEKATAPANLVTIDTAAGKLTSKGTTLAGVDGLEWFCPLAFEFAPPSATVGPGKAQSISVPLMRGPRIKGAATVAYATKDGSAHAGRDYTASSGAVSFANNATQQSLSVSVTPDQKAGEARSFEVVLSNPSGGGTVGAPLKVTISPAAPKLKVVGPKHSGKRLLFRLTSNEKPVSFRCKLDHGKFKPCGKNGAKGAQLKLPALRTGLHKLVIEAVNGVGLKSRPAKKTFRVR